MRQRWVYVTVVVILALTGLFIGRLRLSEIPDLAVGHSPKPPSLGQPRSRSVVYELGGTEGAAATASYLDASGVNHAVQVRLPWTFALSSQKLTFPSGVTASADRADVSCRVMIDGAVRAAQQGSSVADCQVPVS